MKKRLWLIEQRSKKELTQEEAAKTAGIDRTTYCHIENGLRNPSVKTAKQIAKTLGFDWTLFFNEKCGDTMQLPTGTDSN